MKFGDAGVYGQFSEVPAGRRICPYAPATHTAQTAPAVFERPMWVREATIPDEDASEAGTTFHQ